jgi:branched-subunit amino acid ABC-type transport system permease component
MPPFFQAGNIRLGGIVISSNAVVTIIVAAVCMLLLTLLVQKTKMGTAMRPSARIWARPSSWASP